MASVIALASGAMVARSRKLAASCSSKEWDRHRPSITRMYLSEGRSLAEVQKALQEVDFNVSLRQLKAWMGRWKLNKYHRLSEMRTAVALCATMKPPPARFRIQGQEVTYSEIVLYFRRKGIADPLTWLQATYRDGFTLSRNVEVIESEAIGADDPEAMDMSWNRSPISNAHTADIDQRPNAGNRIFETATTSPCNQKNASLFPKSPRSGIAIQLFPMLPSEQILWIMRDYCTSYLESPAALLREESVESRSTPEAQFSQMMNAGVCSIASGDVMAGFSSINIAFNLICSMIQDHHPASVAAVLASVCDLDNNNLSRLTLRLVQYTCDLTSVLLDPGHALIKLFTVLSNSESDRESDRSDVAVLGVQYALEVFQDRCGNLHWRTLSLKEYFCSCLYHTGTIAEAIRLRETLLEEQETVYGRCASNVIATIIKIATERLHEGNIWAADTGLRDALERSQALEGFDKANARFGALEGLAMTAIAAAERIPGNANDVGVNFVREDRNGLRNRTLQDALRLLLEAEMLAQTWFGPQAQSTKNIGRKIGVCEEMLKAASVAEHVLPAEKFQKYIPPRTQPEDDDQSLTLVDTECSEDAKQAGSQSEGFLLPVQTKESHEQPTRLCKQTFETSTSQKSEAFHSNCLTTLKPSTNNTQRDQSCQSCPICLVSTRVASDVEDQVSLKSSLVTTHVQSPSESVAIPFSPVETRELLQFSPHTADKETSLSSDLSADVDNEQSVLCSSSATERKEEIRNVSARLARSLLETFVKNVAYEVPIVVGGNSAAVQTTHSEKKEVSVSSSATAVSNSRLSKKRSYYEFNDDLDDLDDQDDGGDRKRPRATDPELTSANPLLACPYYRYDSARYSPHNLRETAYRRCSSVVLRDIPRLKQHLRRVHRGPDHYCGRCFRKFKAQRDVDLHLRQVPICEVTEPRFQEQMDNDQFKAVTKRNIGVNTLTEWFKIWKILFPPAIKPPESHAFADGQSAGPIRALLEHIRDEGPTQLLMLLHEEVSLSSEQAVFSREEISDILDGATERAVSRLFEALRPRVDALEPRGSPTQPQNQDLVTQQEDSAQTRLPIETARGALFEQLPTYNETFDPNDLLLFGDTNEDQWPDMG